MTTIERKDLVDAVLHSRDEIDPELDTELLQAVVDAEAGAAGDGESALRAIDATVAAAIRRGVGHVEPGPQDAEADTAVDADETGEDEI